MNSEAIKYFREKREELTKLQEINQQKRKRLFVLRIIIFIAALVIPVLLFSDLAQIILGVTLGMVAFLYIVRKDYLLEKNLKRIQAGINATANEIGALEESQFPAYNGTRFENRAHPYTSDLNIFGENSMYHFINRTFTRKGEDQLAQWLLSPLHVNEILEKHEAVKDLASKPDLLLHILTISELNSTYEKSERVNILETQSSSIASRLQKIRSFCFLLSAINLASFVLWITNHLNYMALILIVFFNYFLIHGFSGKLLNKAFGESTNLSGQLRFFEEFIRVFEENRFDSQLLSRLSQQLVVSGQKASLIIRKIRKALKRNDYRLNLVIQLTINSWLYTDIWFLLHFNKIKAKYWHNTKSWFSVVGHLEALTSLSVMQFNQHWIFPVVKEDECNFSTEGLGHPLIHSDKRVVNTVQMMGEKRLLIVTGSNMSGKSTLLRSIGVNMVLAFAGAPVCAKTFVTGNFRLISYMMISDSLHENISTFQAELLRIKHILEETRKHKNVFVLLDELLRGTNTKDRELGCKAIVTQLLRDEVLAIVATHDLNLTNIEHHFPAKVENCHFDIQIEGKNMFFDYKIKKGVCNTFNASLMLKEIGLDLDAIKAFEFAKEN